MAQHTYFRTGENHLLCEIPGLDSQPYPKNFQNCWDSDHVRLPCSTRPRSVELSAWPTIVQGLTTPITDSRDLIRIISSWNREGRAGWNMDALESFLNQRTEKSKASSNGHTSNNNSRLHPGRDDYDTDTDYDSDTIMSEDVGFDDEKPGESQFLDRDERDRFFRVILPRMQELALRLPELVKKPIPFLKPQEDSAVTLSQEQIACLLANAFFCTYPCRNGPQHQRPSRNRSHSPTGRLAQHGQKRKSEKQGMGRGRTLNEEPKDLHKSKSNNRPNPGDPFRNSSGQMSLFAYFNKKDPVVKSALVQMPVPRAPSPNRVTAAPQESQSRFFEQSTLADELSNGGSRDGQVRGPHECRSFPRYPSINFTGLFGGADDDFPCTTTNAAKLRCIIHYFDRVTSKMPRGVVTFHRQVLQSPLTLAVDERVLQSPIHYAQVRIDVDNPLEDDSPLDALQLDFANKVIGGGVIGKGAVQEEIRFMICPELIISRLFTLPMQDNEAVLIKGAERYSNYNGYASTFEWHSNHVDKTPRDKLGRRRTELCAIDALPFKSKDQRLYQFREKNLLREINKAIVGFRRSPITSSEWGLLRAEDKDSVPSKAMICTGNWGCGVFGGHLELKFLIQWIAASVCESYSRQSARSTSSSHKNRERELIYYTYGLDDLGAEIDVFASQLRACVPTIEPERILECILQYPRKSSRGEIVQLPEKSLLDYLGTAFGFGSLSVSSHPSSVGTTFDPTLGSMEGGVASLAFLSVKTEEEEQIEEDEEEEEEE